MGFYLPRILVLLITLLILIQIPTAVTSEFNTEQISAEPTIPTSTPDWDRTINLAFSAQMDKVTVDGQEFDFVSIDECLYTFIPGQPKIPMRVLNLNFETKIHEVKVELTYPVIITGLTLASAPSPTRIVPGGVELVNADPVKNVGFVPKQAHNLNYLGMGEVEGERRHVYNLEIFPLRYDASELSGILYRNAVVSVDLEDGSDTEPEDDPSSEPQTSSGTGSARSLSSRIEYLIITTDRLRDDLQPLQPKCSMF